jgi:hypothetical protein
MHRAARALPAAMTLLALATSPACLLISSDEHAAWLDRDGDGVNGVDDCDDQNPDAFEVVTWFADSDGDGLGTTGIPQPSCGQPEGYVLEGGDECDDAPGVFAPLVWYADVDGDGRGDEDSPVGSCTQPAGYVSDLTDCNDREETIYPDAPEVCNDKDDDCDGFVDEEGATGTTVYFVDLDGDGHGVPGSAVEECSQPAGYATTADDCDDGDPDVSPTDPEVCGDGIDNDCDGGNNGCRPTADIDAVASSAFTTEGLTASAGLGSALSAADFDEDGDLDLLVGADLAYSGKGAAYLVEGPLDRPLSLITATELLGQAGDYAGAGVQFIGDYDGDGVNDLAVGARMSSNRDIDELPVSTGRVYLVSGDASSGNLTTAAMLTLEGTNGARPFDDGIGEVIASFGDVNGDGFADLGVGSTSAEPAGGDMNGGVYLLYGPTTGTLAAASVPDVIWGAEIQDFAGSSLLGLDADSDGDTDIAVGVVWRYEAYPASGATAWPGGIDFFFDPPSGAVDILDSDATFMGSTLGEGFAGAMSEIGDVNGDGHQDLLVGSLGGFAEPLTNPGAYVLLGPFTTADAVSATDTTFTGTWADDAMSDVVGSAGDFDGDGNTDIVITAAGAAEAWLHYGPFKGTHVITDGVRLFGGAGSELGRALIGGYDLDEDGHDDLILGAPGHTGGAGADTGAIFIVLGSSL